MALALLWKEKGIPSQQALGRLLTQGPFSARKGRRGIGHSGTLDPFAEGWLLVGVDEGTKFLGAFQGFDKEYEVEMILGATSVSLDTDSELQRAAPEYLEKFLSQTDWEQRLVHFLKTAVGRGTQVPPQFSAIRVGSKRAYDFARAGKEVELKARPFEVLETQHLSAQREDSGLLCWRFRVRVTSGTYIRALARDWGQALVGFPGMLRGLVRTGIGSFGRKLPSGATHYLGVKDLENFFEPRQITPSQVSQIRQSGLWRGEPSAKPQLLLSEEGEPVAFTEAPSGQLGRVFLSDPLKI